MAGENFYRGTAYDKPIKKITSPLSHTATSGGRGTRATPRLARVLKLHKAGQSLRSIAEDVNLSVRTVRTIVDKKDGVDRSRVARIKLVEPSLLAGITAQRKVRATLPRRVSASKEKMAKLIKEAKGHEQ